jgi:hypothetical protein
MILFQAQIEEHQKLAKHYRELAAKREALAESLLAFQQQADSDLSSLRLLVDKCKEVAPNAIASLKFAVLTLFDSDDDGNDDGAHQPTDPTPDTDDDDFELLCLNGETGDCLTTADLDGAETIEAEKAAQAEDDGDSEISTGTPLTYTQAIKNRCGACWGYVVKTKADIKAGFINRTNLNFMQAVNLERTGREFYETVEAYLDRLYYNGQSCQLEECPASSLVGQHYQLTSPLASLVWEDAPMLGQCCTVQVSQAQPEKTTYIEFVRVTDRVGYIKVNTTGEIKSVYVGFNNKTRAKAWANYLEIVTPKIELRLALRVGDWKHEVKLSGLSLKQIERLAAEDLDKMPPTKEPSLPPSYKPRSIAQPVNPSEVGSGDIVTTLLTPGGSYKIIQIMPNGILDCENLTTGTRLGLRPNAVSLVQKAEKPQPPEPIEFNDLVEVVADANDTVGLVGTFGRVKTIKGSRIGVEIDEQLTYFDSKELKVKARAVDEVAPQSQGLKSGQLLMGNRIVTTGNYTGLARRSSILNTRIGTADKVAALELMKGGLSPELAMAVATGTADTDYDF